MFPKKSLALAGAVLALLGATVSAQTQPRKPFVRSHRPLKSVSLDLATGTLTRTPVVKNRAASTTVDFSNNDLGGFVGVASGNCTCEWFDAGIKGSAGNHSDLMSDIVFSYCSASLDPRSGGPGGSVKLGFYEGYTLGGGAPSTAVAVLTLTGLPANSTSSSYFDGYTCYFIHVTFADLVAFADGPIAYSWKFLDVGTDGVFAGTFPSLSCVASCSGQNGQVDGQGMTDAIDEYSPPGTLHSTFTYGTSQGTFTSMSMEIAEATDVAATSQPYNAVTTPNADILSATPAIVGRPWTATVTLNPPRADGSAFTVLLYTNRSRGPNGYTMPGGRGLVSGRPLGSLAGIHSATTGSVSVTIPPSFDLVGVHYACQATILGGGIKMSSAIEGTTGTF